MKRLAKRVAELEAEMAYLRENLCEAAFVPEYVDRAEEGAYSDVRFTDLQKGN